jgi:predicted nucleic acid-binding protein
MSFVVLDTDVLASASPGDDQQAQEGWRLLQCLINERHSLVVSPELWEEYKRIPDYSMMSRAKLASYAFTKKIKMDSEPQDDTAQEQLKQLGVDEKDIGWVLLAAKHGAIFVTREKYAPRRQKGARREQEHQRVVREVESKFGVCIWHPDYAIRRLCSNAG